MEQSVKEDVLSEEDVCQLFPALNNERFPLVRRLLKRLKITDINEVHARHIRQRGAAFARAALSDPAINVKYVISGREHLETMRGAGAFATVSNHPFGSIDGIILIDIVGSVRPDYGVLVNGFLSRIGCLSDNFIPIKPPKGLSATDNSTHGLREVIRRFEADRPVGFFPAGGISQYHTRLNTITDSPWQESCSRMILHAPVPVYPIFFEGRNSFFFHLLGWVNWMIRTPRIPAELFNKRGHTVRVHIGAPVPADVIARFRGHPRELSLFLYDRTYSLKPAKDKHGDPDLLCH